jgi:hypothetical protein
MFRFTIRDLLWLMVVVALIAVWRSDLARQEAIYRDMLKDRDISNDEFQELVDKARHNPELNAELTELRKAGWEFAKLRLAKQRALHERYVSLRNKAHKLPAPPTQGNAEAENPDMISELNRPNARRGGGSTKPLVKAMRP